MTTTVDFRSGQPILAPLTRGGNLPFRRLCTHLGARITTSEMAYARKLVRGSRPELALLRKHDDEACFGVQIATASPTEGVVAGQLAVERGAVFVDVNFGCPIHDVVRRGMGATLLRRPAAMARLIEAMARDLPVPVTAKIRSGWSESKINALEVARALEEAGAAAITLHARSREQRYTRIADWELIARLAAELTIPVIGNGDLLTHYEAQWRQNESGCAGVMLARGALIKPWLFREMAEGRSWEPTAPERVAVYRQLAVYMKEHFRSDQEGRRRAMYFLPWHLDFFCRYRPLPESEWGERARQHPLMQTRIEDESGDGELPLLEAMLRDPRPEMHELIAGALWDSESDDEAVTLLTQLGAEVPPELGAAESMRTSNG